MILSLRYVCFEMFGMKCLVWNVCYDMIVKWHDYYDFKLLCNVYYEMFVMKRHDCFDFKLLPRSICNETRVRPLDGDPGRVDSSQNQLGTIQLWNSLKSWKILAFHKCLIFWGYFIKI